MGLQALNNPNLAAAAAAAAAAGELGHPLWQQHLVQAGVAFKRELLQQDRKPMPATAAAHLRIPDAPLPDANLSTADFKKELYVKEERKDGAATGRKSLFSSLASTSQQQQHDGQLLNHFAALPTVVAPPVGTQQRPDVMCHLVPNRYIFFLPVLTAAPTLPAFCFTSRFVQRCYFSLLLGHHAYTVRETYRHFSWCRCMWGLVKKRNHPKFISWQAIAEYDPGVCVQMEMLPLLPPFTGTKV